MCHPAMSQPPAKAMCHSINNQLAVQAINQPALSLPAERQRIEPRLSRKGRIQPTPELHELFMNAVHEMYKRTGLCFTFYGPMSPHFFH